MLGNISAFATFGALGRVYAFIMWRAASVVSDFI